MFDALVAGIRVTMSADPKRPYVDALDMSAEETHVYEAIAALEYRGRAVSRAELAETAALPEAELDQALERLTARKAIIRRGSGSGAQYEPATRDWSIVPPRNYGG